MARPTLEKQAEQFRLRVASSKKWREEERFDETWNRLKDLYALKHYEGFSPEDRVAVAISFATINVIAPSVAINHPKTTVLARRPEDDAKAVISEAVLDWLWKTNDVGDEFRRAVKDMLIVGHGWVKTGWRLSQSMVERPTDEIDAEFAAKVTEAEQYAAANPEMAGSMPTDDEIMAAIPTTKLTVTEDRPFVERVSPHDMFVDPDATSLNDAAWVAQRVIRPLDEVRKDKTYEASARAQVKGDLLSAWSEPHRAKRKPQPDEENAQKCVVWEFYDLRAQTVCVFAAQGKGFLVKPQPMPYRIGLPFVMLRNYDVPDAFYPIGDLEAIEPLQHELNRTRSQLMNARQQYARKLLVRMDALGPEGRQALEAPGDSVVPVMSNTETLADIAAPLPINQIPPDLFGYGDMIAQDINVVSGVSDYQRGSSPEIRRTATEASMIQDAVNARSSDKLAIVEKAIGQISKNLLGLVAQYQTTPKVARVLGSKGMPIWVPYDRETVDIDMDFVVQGGSTMPKNEAWKQNQAMQLLQMMAPMIGTFVDGPKIAAWTLQQFGIKNAEDFIMQGPPPGMMPPGVPQGAPPPEAGPPAPEAVDPAETEPGEGQVPPEILAQLQGQLPNGLDLMTMGGA